MKQVARQGGGLFLALIGAASAIGLSMFSPCAAAQTKDLTVDVLVNSSNTVGYNTDPNNPGEYQRYPERYLEHLQIPYRVIDVATTPPPDLTTVQLIFAAHKGLGLSSLWQQAITSAVAQGVGFVNFDSDPAIGSQTHIQTIFGATGAVQGAPSTWLVVPAAVQPGGSTPHYISAMQVHFLSDPPGDLLYKFHGDAFGTYPTATATILQGAHGTVIAQLFDGNHSAYSTLILATGYGNGRAVNFGTYDYLHPGGFGFMMGVDDLFWRSLVWAARKPFVVRAYPRMFAVQLDDNSQLSGLPGRLTDFFDSSLTGNLLPDGTGGPWKLDVYTIADNLAPGTTDRSQFIQQINAGHVKQSLHRLSENTGGDLFWNGTVGPLSDSAFQSLLNTAMADVQGNGGNDTLPLSRSNIPEFWDYSNNVGFDLWHTLGVRYILEIQKAGVEYLSSKTDTQRLPYRPFRIYEQPPNFNVGDEFFPIFWADDYTIGSRSGLPAQTFYGFSTQILTDNYRFPGPDAKFPDYLGSGTYPLANSLENWQVYAWRFWSSLAPVEIFTHDENDLENVPVSQRRQFISQYSLWLNAHGARHVFIEQMGDYMYARNKSLLATAQATPSTITLNLTGKSQNADGTLVPTKTLVFYGDDNGTWVDVPGFAPGGSTFSFPNSTPPAIGLSATSLSFLALPGGSNPAAQQVNVSNAGGGTLTWFATSSASWLTVSPASGTNSDILTISAASSSLATGNYTGTVTLTALNASNSPQTISVSLVVGPTSFVLTPGSLTFAAFQNQGNPPSQTLTVGNAGGGTLTWTASTNVPWLLISATSGTAPSPLTVSVNTSGLGVGTYTGTITFVGGAANNSPKAFPVTLSITGVLLSTNFSAGTLDGWAISPLGLASNWSVANNAAVYNGGGHTQIFGGNSAWTDYTVQTDIKLSTMSNYPGGLRGRVNPVTGASYAVWLYPGSNDLVLYKTVGWNIDAGNTVLAQKGLIFDTTAPHTIKLSMQGSQLQVFYDSALILSATDTSYASGMIALDVSTQVISFTNILVTGTASSTSSFSPSVSTLNFQAFLNGSNPSPQNVQVSSIGAGQVAWTARGSAAWLAVSPAGGVTPGTLHVSVNTSGLTAGSYTGTITFSSFGALNSPQTLTVNLSEAPPPPSLVTAPATLTFSGAQGGNSPAAQTLSIQNGGAGQFNWTAASDSSWLTLSSPSGTTPVSLQVNVSMGTLAAGSYLGNITITAPGVAGSPTNVPVSLVIGGSLMSDDFSSGALNGWANSPLGLASDWSVVNQALQNNGGGHTQVYAGNSAWTDYSMQADIKLASLSNWPGGIRGRIQPGTGGSYAVWLYPGYQQIRLYRTQQWNIDGGFTTLGIANVNFDTTAFHTVKLAMQGSQIQVFYDSQVVLTVTDALYTNGMVGLDVSNQPVTFDNVLVTGNSPVSPESLAPGASALSFSATAGGPNPAAQTVGLSATGTGALAWTASTSAPWLSVSPASGSTPSSVSVSVNTSGLASGTYSGTIVLFSRGDPAAPEALKVTLTIQ